MPPNRGAVLHRPALQMTGGGNNGVIRSIVPMSIRFLTGPGGRMLFVVGVVMAAWIWWAWTPLEPLASWTISEYESAMTECSRDTLMLVTVASSTAADPEGGIPSSILDGPIRIWDLAARRERVSIPVSGPPLRFVRLAADNSWLLTVDENWIFKLWDPATGRFRAMLNPPTGTPANVNSHPWFCLSEDDRLIAVYDSDAIVVHVCEGLTGRLVAKIAGARPPLALHRTATSYWQRFPSLARSPAFGTSPPANSCIFCRAIDIRFTPSQLARMVACWRRACIRALRRFARAGRSQIMERRDRPIARRL